MAAGKGDTHSPLADKRMRTEEVEGNKSRNPVFLEKMNRLSKKLPYPPSDRGDGGSEHVLSMTVGRFTSGKQLAKKERWEQKPSAFTEVRRLKDKLWNEKVREGEREGTPGQLNKEQHPEDSVLNMSGSAFSFVCPNRARGEQKSAFSKPAKCLVERTALTSALPAHKAVETLGDLSGFINSMEIMCCGNLLNSRFIASDLCGPQMTQTNPSQNCAFPYPSEQWPGPKTGLIHSSPSSFPSPSPSSSSSLTLLPPTFTAFGVAAQNWCAKCNLSFRMTSDLVFHMRSHHKKEYSSPESQSKRKREEKLACPICHEYFREHHHLSRHMTSHN
ncbi:zinc finger protein 488 [Tachyglossus aculeatus]|uniref:zinc finger protein 488 n=1 Tax=Tachyglossus aculeatus TaxID=9261 RepID=UPI0018F4FE7F|nr:zinc finger protein 488 [Tachyglossus aculeatus]XP_038600047.1 zinc finger protein 488 [Tachyglossus aculeatus]XP_038600048.1 zinc finger protein 488 [Tachyglossus aculeatus]XP_038600049.1 zinc finger protein 488 [Tachyglossus aculeatus]